MINRLVVREFKDASFVFDPVTQNSLFIEGTLSDLVSDFLENNNRVVEESYFSRIPMIWRKKAREEVELMRISVKNFLGKIKHESVTVVDKTQDENHDSPMKKLSEYAIKNWQIANVSIELTYRCNLNCKWCYLSDCDKKSLQIKQFQVIADQLRKTEAIFILLTGGEIFLRKDIVEIMKIFKNLGFALEAKSNGLLIDSSLIEKIANLNLFNLQVSVYGIKDQYSLLVGGYYHFSRLAKNINELARQKIPLTLSVLVGKHNIDDLYRYDDTLRNLGAQEIFYSPYITPQRDGRKDAISFRLTRDELDKKFYPFLDKINGFVEPVKYRNNCKRGPACYTGRDQIAIDPFGAIFPCLDFRLPLGHISEGLDTVLKRRKNLLLPYTLKKIRKCSTCSIVEYCDSCIGTALLESGKFTKPSQHKCDISRFYFDANKKRKEVIAHEEI